VNPGTCIPRSAERGLKRKQLYRPNFLNFLEFEMMCFAAYSVSGIT